MATTRTTPFLLGLAALALMGARDGCERPSHLVPPSPCEGLSERACLDADACEPVYGRADCECPDIRVCDCAPRAVYDGCREREEPRVCPEVLCDVYCPYGHEVDENGCDTCSCLPPPGCKTDEDCREGERCVQDDACVCPACYGPGCPPCHCPETGACVPAHDCEGAALDEMGNCLGPYDQPLAPECCERACEQVITYAADPATGTCYAFATPCDVPDGYVPCEE